MRIIELENAAPSTPAPLIPGNASTSSGTKGPTKGVVAASPAPSGTGEEGNEGETQSITAEATLRICKILLKVGTQMGGVRFVHI